MPPVIVLNNPEAYDIWILYRALNRRFLPSQILEEREDLLTDIITLDSAYEAIKEKYNEANDSQ